MTVPALSEGLRGKRVALVHDWLVSQRGGENVLDAFCEMLPEADLFTLVHKKGACDRHIEAAHPRASLLRHVPGIEKRYPYFLAVMPWVIERFDLSAYDVILSSSHCVAKGVHKRPDAVHVSYIHAPMRYMWDRFDEYFSAERSGLLTRTVAGACRSYLQSWDRRSAAGVDRFIANSHFIADKVKLYYGREAEVVHPFCELDRFAEALRLRKAALAQGLPVDAPYLMVTALVPYKRVDLAIEAFRGTGGRLHIVGNGPDFERLRALAGPEVTFLGSIPNERLVELYASARALLFPGVEDFGIVPLEAMASGLPVIALGEGGVRETVVDGETGIFFEGGTAQAIRDAVRRFEDLRFNSDACSARAQQFSRVEFQRRVMAVLGEVAKN